MTLQGFYYKCRRVVRDGRDVCPDRGSRPNLRTEKLEGRIWSIASDLTKTPEQLREDLKRMVELRPDHEREAEADRVCSGYQDLAAKGLMIPRRARTRGVADPTGPYREAGAGQGRGAGWAFLRGTMSAAPVGAIKGVS